MTPRHPTPVLDGSYRRRKGVLFVHAAEGLPVRLSGHAPPAAVHGLPLPSEERGRRVAELLASARAA
jgi:hypothetical protein